MQPFDFKLSPADFEAVPWESILGAAAERTCFEYCAPLKAEAGKCKASGDDRGDKVLTLLHAAASLCPDLSSQHTPFQPGLLFKTFRSPALEDFAPGDVAALAQLALNIKDSEFRARIADIAWVLGKDYRHARLAIEAYRQSAALLETTARFPVFIDRLERAAQLTLLVAKRDRPFVESLVTEIEGFVAKRATTETKWPCADLMKLLRNIGGADAAKYALLSETLATSAEDRGEWHIARNYWKCKAEWHRVAKQESEFWSALTKAAETYVGEAEAALKRPTPSHGACASLLKQAVEAFRKLLPRTKQRIEELHVRILQEQELCVTETTTLSFSTDISEMVDAATAAFGKKPLHEVLVGLALIHESPSKDMLRAKAEESLAEGSFAHLFPTRYLTAKGKEIAAKPGGIFTEGASRELCLKAEMMQRLKWHRSLLVSGCIQPALHVINGQHRVRREDLLFLVEDNPFVPPGHEGIFLRGLHAGLTGDFLVAAHLLIPQIENSIRHLLYHYAGEIRTSKLGDDNTQLEIDLNELLYSDDVEKVLTPDICFDLRAVLTEKGYGANVRNELSHGLMPTDQFVGEDAVYAWWLVYRICALPVLVQMQGAAVTGVQSDAQAGGVGGDEGKPA